MFEEIAARTHISHIYIILNIILIITLMYVEELKSFFILQSRPRLTLILSLLLF